MYRSVLNLYKKWGYFNVRKHSFRYQINEKNVLLKKFPVFSLIKYIFMEK